MKDELDAKLCQDYPKLFVNRGAPMQQTCMCWGFCCGDGWYPLIDTLCSKIQSYIDYNPHLNIEQVVVDQVKEKYGTLRFYYHGGDDRIDGMISLAEYMSARICEECGKPGKVRDRSWVVTRCDECLEKLDKR